jgi:hypothetical protein
MHGRTMAAFTLAATVILLVCQRAFGAEPCSTVHVFYTPACAELPKVHQIYLIIQF